MEHGSRVSFLVVLACTVPVSACLPIPHTHTMEPAATFAVRDSAGHPVSRARVRLYAAIIVGRHVRFADSATTDSSGVLRFAKHRELHAVMMFVADGEAPWVWGWCADAPGMKPTYGALDAPPGDTVRVELHGAPQTDGSACPFRPSSLSDLPR